MDIVFNDCNYVVPGIKSLYLLVELSSGATYPYFPLNYYVHSADTSIISTIGQYAVFQRMDIGKDANHVQERVSDEKGKYFNKTITFSIGIVNFTSTKMFNGYFFKRNIVNPLGYSRPINIDGYNTCAIFEDEDGNWWCCGYDLPLKVVPFSIVIDPNSNAYNVQLTSRSNMRTRAISQTWARGTDYIIFS